MAENNLTRPLQDALEEASLRCVALQGQVFALGQAYAHGDTMDDELFQTFMWGIERDLETIKETIDRVPYQREETQTDPKMNRVATFPAVALEAHCTEKGLTIEEWAKNPSMVRETLNDPGMSEYRTAQGGV